MERKREDLGKILVSALERITTLRNIPLNESLNTEAPQQRSVAAEMARLLPSMKVNYDTDKHEADKHDVNNHKVQLQSGRQVMSSTNLTTKKEPI